MANAKGVIAWIFGFVEAYTTQVVPIEMVTIVAGIIICGLVYPFLGFT